MKIVTLMENTAACPELAAEHGLSLYIEACGKRILFDTGQSEGFLRNAQLLGVDLSRVDFAVLSHGHYDHGGGVTKFLEINHHAPVYVRREAFGEHYNAEGRYIGLDPKLAETDRLIFTGAPVELGPGIELSPGGEAILPIQPFGLWTVRQGVRRPEEFRHEQYLMIRENGRRILFSGCSHRGIENIVHWFRPDVLVGGFHFMKLSPQDPALAAAARRLLAANTTYYTAHCTGEAQFRAMKAILGQRLQYLSAGTRVELEE